MMQVTINGIIWEDNKLLSWRILVKPVTKCSCMFSVFHALPYVVKQEESEEGTEGADEWERRVPTRGRGQFAFTLSITYYVFPVGVSLVILRFWDLIFC